MDEIIGKYEKWANLNAVNQNFESTKGLKGS